MTSSFSSKITKIFSSTKNIRNTVQYYWILKMFNAKISILRNAFSVLLPKISILLIRIWWKNLLENYSTFWITVLEFRTGVLNFSIFENDTKIFSKVQTFWDAHKFWKNLPHGFDKSADLLTKRQNHEEDFFKLCVLLKKFELYNWTLVW